MITERIAGFDAREMWLDLDHSWPGARREEYLFRLDILKPLSVDTMVWPSVFSFPEFSSPLRRFGYQDTWSNLDSLQTALAGIAKTTSLPRFHLIAFSLFLRDVNDHGTVPWDSILPQSDPADREPTWSLLGYDVADAWALSALMNCGFVANLDDTIKLRKEWGPKLNKFHLFDKFDDAMAFKYFSDERLKEDHAPSFVFGIWLII